MNRLRHVFGSRGALAAASSAFGGIAGRVDRVLGDVIGQNSTNSVAVVGPPRSGRSSVLRQIAHPPHLQRNGGAGTIVVEAELRQFRRRPEEAVAHLIGRIAATMAVHGCDANAVERAGTVRGAIDAVIANVPGRLVIAIDDFECVASDLRKEQQIDLRQAIYKRDQVAYVVGSRMELGYCTEEFGDALSEIAPIFTTRRLEPLRLRELENLVADACPALPRVDAVTLAGFVYGEVGGFPAWFQRAIAVTAERLSVEDLPVDRLADLAGDLRDDIIADLGQDLRAAFLRLPRAARRLVQSCIAATEGYDPGVEAHTALWFGGWMAPARRGDPVRQGGKALAAWLARHGDDPVAPVSAEPADRYDELVAAVDALNDRHRQGTGGKGPPIMRTAVFSIPRHMPFLRRRIRNRSDLDSFAHAMALLLYDGTGGATKGPLTLPQWCYDDPNSVVRHIMDLRHATAHLPHADPAEEERRQQSISRVYERYLTVPSPVEESEFAQLADGLMAEAIRFIRTLAGFAPISPSLHPSAVFGNPGS